MPRSIDRLLAARAREKPSACFLRFPDQDLTFDEVDRRSTNLAASLAALGVRRGDLVPLFMPNRPEFVLSWFAVCKLGAVAALINTAMRGPALVHAMNLSGAEIAIVDQSLLDAIDSVSLRLAHLRLLVVTDDMAAEGTVRNLVTLRLSAVESSAVGHNGSADITSVTGEHDPAMVIFTSGTTGPSKGCVLSHRYAVRQAELMIEHLELRDDDVLYCPFPLFHLDASILTVMPALVLGATAAIGTRFSLSGFWHDVRAFDATVFDFMGATLTMLHKVPAAPEDIDNPVRLAWGVPVPGFAAEFEARFGLKLVELYGSTDAGVPIYHPIDEHRRSGSCGRAIPSYEVRLFDEGGMPVPTGEVGEIVIRPNEPSLMSMGYYGMPEATVAANRDLWFHTGDLARQDEDGYFYFVGRSSDSIRRRGENISAFEVEEVIKLHPHVMDAAAYGVPSELTEDDVMIAVVPRPGQTIDPAELIKFCRGRMARHMLPRYIDLISDLPRTPTEKVEKRFLIDRGVTASTWDRESKTPPKQPN